MTPNQWVMLMLLVVASIYAITAGAYLFSGRPGMMVCFVGYIIANLGLVWDAIRG